MRENIARIYQYSLIYSLISLYREKLLIYFNFSIIGRITDLGALEINILDSSNVCLSLRKLFLNFKNKAFLYLNSSKILTIKDKSHKIRNIFSFKSTCIIIILVTMINVPLSFILQKGIVLWGWWIRILFLTFGIFGLFSNADWQVLKNSSFVFRLFKNKQFDN
ncbi:MAG: hypothetical protein AB1629_07485 [Candidatus Omnitrophota bacterium]